MIKRNDKTLRLWNYINIVFLCLFFQVQSYSENNADIYFNVAPLNIREKPNVNSKTVGVLFSGTIVKSLKQTELKEYIDVFHDCWHYIEYKNGKGWVYGGYLMLYENQDIVEFIRRYEFVRYFHDRKRFMSKLGSYTFEVYLGFGAYNQNLDKSNLVFNLSNYS